MLLHEGIGSKEGAIGLGSGIGSSGLIELYPVQWGSFRYGTRRSIGVTWDGNPLDTLMSDGGAGRVGRARIPVSHVLSTVGRKIVYIKRRDGVGVSCRLAHCHS
jgi:hypothetical protein